MAPTAVGQREVVRSCEVERLRVAEQRRHDPQPPLRLGRGAQVHIISRPAARRLLGRTPRRAQHSLRRRPTGRRRTRRSRTPRAGPWTPYPTHPLSHLRPPLRGYTVDLAVYLIVSTPVFSRTVGAMSSSPPRSVPRARSARAMSLVQRRRRLLRAARRASVEHPRAASRPTSPRVPLGQIASKHAAESARVSAALCALCVATWWHERWCAF